jgi:two-component system CheB/CheR fusion protein
MYFSAETQATILGRFHFALVEGGFLFLGRAETLMTHAKAFAPVDLKHRISRKVGTFFHGRRAPGGGGVNAGPASPEFELQLTRAAMLSLPVSQLVLDAGGTLLTMTERAREMFGLSAADLGRPIQDLRISYRPIELRSLIEQTTLERRPALVRDIEWPQESGEPRWLDVQVHALSDSAGELIGTSVTFFDVTATRRLQENLIQATQERETAYEELQSTNEELETTNEELQSTVEELETTNEEIQSTNEELETTNEELRSTNDQLHDMNRALRDRGEELNTANAFLQSILASLSGGVVVVDRELRVLAWNGNAEELWGLRADEVRGVHLYNLDFGLPLDAIRSVLKDCLDGDGDGRDLHVDATNRRGHRFQCRIACKALATASGEVRGAILIMDDGSATSPHPVSARASR